MLFSALGIVALLILANALYVAAEFGAVGVRRSRVRRLADDGNPLAGQLLPYVEDAHKLDEYVAVSQIGITLSSLILGAYAQAAFGFRLAPLAERAFGLSPEAALSAVATVILIVLTALQMVIGELVPKSLALQFPDRTAIATVLPMRASLWIFRPLIFLLNGSGTLVLRLLGVRSSGHRHVHSPQEIEMLIAESRDGGLLEPDEQRRLHRALRLNQKKARELMVPADRLSMIDAATPFAEVVERVTASPFSRLPVFRGTRDNIVGTLHAKDLAIASFAGPQRSIDALVRPIATVGPDMSADRLLAFLRGRRVHQAIVRDNDRVLGLVTLQDVLGAFLSDPREGGAA